MLLDILSFRFDNVCMAYSLKNQKQIKELRKTGPKPRPVIDRLWEKVDKLGDDDCWLWGGANGNKTRPPTISSEGKQLIAYRVVFENYYRLLDDGEWVLHTCNNVNCMNPKHLYVGDRILWAQKWHGVEYDSNHHEAIAQKARIKTREYYKNNTEKVKKYESERQMKNKIRAINFLGGICQKCGFDHPSALQFHHRDPKTKSFGITAKELSAPKKRPWDTVIVPELEKCDLLCANCHFLEHSALSASRVKELKAEIAGIGRGSVV